MQKRISGIIEAAILTSISADFLRGLNAKYDSFSLYSGSVAADSRIYKSISALLRESRVILRNSFLGKVTSMDRNYSLANILSNSKLILHLADSCKKCRFSLQNYLKASNSFNLFRGLKGRILRQPFKAGCIFIISVILINVLFCMLSGMRINPWGWFTRIVFLFVAINGLSSDISFEKLYSTSYFMKRLNNPCKI